MKTLICLSLTTLLISVANQCHALMEIRSATPAEARQLGINVRAKPGGPKHIWVQLEFKAEGSLKDFRKVSLEIQDGERFLFGWSALEAKQSESGGIVVEYFLVDRSFLNNVTLRIVTGRLMNDGGNDLRLKDFIDLKALDARTPRQTDEAGAAPAPIAPPASPAR